MEIVRVICKACEREVDGELWVNTPIAKAHSADGGGLCPGSKCVATLIPPGPKEITPR